MTIKEVAKIENRNPETIRRWIRNDTLSLHGYKVKNFDSNKKGYELERLDDFDKSINEASNRLNYYLQMAEVEREHIRFLKEAKHLMESVKSRKE